MHVTVAKKVTEDNFDDLMNKETAWRKSELAEIKLSLDQLKTEVKDSEKPRKDIMRNLRASYLILYSHWEGLVKFMGSLYIRYINSRGITYDEMKDFAKVYCLGLDLKKSSEYKTHEGVLELFNRLSNRGVEIVELDWNQIVETKSNLNFENLIQILKNLGLYEQVEELYRVKIQEKEGKNGSFRLLKNYINKEFVGVRNEISHGHKGKFDGYISEIDDYNKLHDHIIFILDVIEEVISDSRARDLYRKNSLL